MSGMRPSSFFASRRASASNSSGSSRSSSSVSPRVLSSSRRSDERTPLTSRRETVTLSSGELNKIFDAFNSISSQMRVQGEVLENFKSSQDCLLDEVHQLREEHKIVSDKLHSLVQSGEDDDGKIPPEISADVHLLYNSLSIEQQYKSEESILTQHNVAVRQELEKQMTDQDKGYSIKFVKRGVVRYYETKRKLYLQSLPENQERAEQQKLENKFRSRRKRLFVSRAKVAEGQDKERIGVLNQDYVSDEENGSGANKGQWVVRPPVWRSDEANLLMRRLQEKLDISRVEETRPKVVRVAGRPSTRSKPRLVVGWALHSDAHDRSRSPSPLPTRRQTRSQSRSPEKRRERRERRTFLNSDSD